MNILWGIIILTAFGQSHSRMLTDDLKMERDKIEEEVVFWIDGFRWNNWLTPLTRLTRSISKSVPIIYNGLSSNQPQEGEVLSQDVGKKLPRSSRNMKSRKGTEDDKSGSKWSYKNTHGLNQEEFVRGISQRDYLPEKNSTKPELSPQQTEDGTAPPSGTVPQTDDSGHEFDGNAPSPGTVPQRDDSEHEFDGNAPSPGTVPQRDDSEPELEELDDKEPPIQPIKIKGEPKPQRDDSEHEFDGNAPSSGTVPQRDDSEPELEELDDEEPPIPPIKIKGEPNPNPDSTAGKNQTLSTNKTKATSKNTTPSDGSKAAPKDPNVTKSQNESTTAPNEGDPSPKAYNESNAASGAPNESTNAQNESTTHPKLSKAGEGAEAGGSHKLSKPKEGQAGNATGSSNSSTVQMITTTEKISKKKKKGAACLFLANSFTILSMLVFCKFFV